MKNTSVTTKAEEKQAGLTLIEVLVSIAIFTIVLTVALGSFVSLIDASSRSRNRSETISSLTFIMNDMARRVRTGYNYDCGADIDNPDNISPDNCKSGDNSFGYIDSTAKKIAMASFTHLIVAKMQYIAILKVNKNFA